MALLLAIEPDSRQAALVSEVVRGLSSAELILTGSAGEALEALDSRVPDLILTSTLLSPADETLLTERLRSLDKAGAHVRTLVIPLLADSEPKPEAPTGLLGRFGWRKPRASAPDGCDPSVFAGQITEYLNRAHVLRRAFATLPPSGLEPVLSMPADLPSEVPLDPAPLETPFLLQEPDPVPEPPPVAQARFGESLFVDADPPPPVADRTPAPTDAGSLLSSAPEPLVPDLDALSAELDAVFAADAAAAMESEGVPADSTVSTVAEDTVADVAEDAEPVSVGPSEFFEIGAELDAEPELTSATLEADEPETVTAEAPREDLEPPPFRPDLLELLAAIQLDLEPLRSPPERRTAAPSRPSGVQDEWGFFDPQQCGMAALLARLDQIARDRETAAAD